MHFTFLAKLQLPSVYFQYFYLLPWKQDVKTVTLAVTMGSFLLHRKGKKLKGEFHSSTHAQAFA